MSSAIKDDNLSYISSGLIRRNLFVEKALQGFAEEQFQLALHFLDGTKGFPQSYKHALYWLIQSSNNGNIEAVNQLGVCFMNGWGTIKSNEAAFDLIRFAADHGDVTAIINVALMCINGCGTVVDLKQASLYLKKASLLGNGAASYQLGQMYLHGWGVDVDGSTGFEYLTLAADQGVVEAKERLNKTISPPVIRECWQEKRATLEKSANAGNIDAMYRLSQYYERGIDGNIDKMAHLKWLEKAAENKHQQAWSDLQSLYANYDNLDADFKEMITRSRGNSDPEEKDPHVDTPESRKQKLAKRRSLIFRMFHKISVAGSAAH